LSIFLWYKDNPCLFSPRFFLWVVAGLKQVNGFDKMYLLTVVDF